MKKSKKIQSAEQVSAIILAFRCPICESEMKVKELKSLVCEQNHTFDFAKQGYLHLLSHPIKSQYEADLFTARQKIIMESNLYTSIHQVISKLIQKHVNVSEVLMIDLGCGEGSHLQRILDESIDQKFTGIGLDIAKEGIMLAAKNYEQPTWLVGDLAHSPIADQSIDVILNILSPSNYQEFKRILTENGLVIKVVPRANYLQELRAAFFVKDEKREYSNEDTISLFQKHFHVLERVHFHDSKKITRNELENLVRMTPLSWSADPERKLAFVNQSSHEITIDLDILIGKNIVE
ncbi:putative RNA methyltransferase [Lederbergia galactosidilytica]|uniref:SAM-dependent methyltransferase n=1 Tax=Lederbergia galactosidilytica TaxID=217031 RepID=A0A177ZM59_9BACI|nr:methyltransferase domain-containing protein [Lederbergia galactosidilytica]KRG08882.1 SAM-dependent methyltransferase [Virgibacillus soli]OAK68420.1 SAM-dependent methyltransferase [Lederbergia galactosidilytica]